MNSSMIPAIILDCDIRSQEGIIQSLGRKKIPIIALSSKQDCPAFNSRYVTKKIISPDINTDRDAYIRFLFELPVKGVLIYSNDVSAVILSRSRERLRNAGYLLNIPDSNALELVFDKWSCFNLSQSLNISYPKTCLVETLDDIEACWDEFIKPVIVKGTRLAGGNYVRISELSEASAALATLQARVASRDYCSRESKIMLQEWMNYEMTDIWHCETVYSTSSKPMGHFTIQHIRTSFMNQGTFSSRLYAGKHVYSSTLIDVTDKLLSSIKWHGFANVDYVYLPDQKKFYLLDVNPRLPGFSYYPSQAGYEMAWYYYCDLTGRKCSYSDKHPSSIYFESFRYPGDVSDGLKNLIKGFLKPGPFFSSYFRLLLPGPQKIIEPVKMDDLGYTLAVQKQNIKKFAKKLGHYVQRKARGFADKVFSTIFPAN